MKNFKKYGAILLIVLILLVFCLPMVFVLRGGEDSQALFKGSLAAAIMFPVLIYVFLMFYQMLKKRNPAPQKDRRIENIVFDVGNVLVDFDWKTYLEGYGFPKEKYESIADATFRSSVWTERDRGLYDEETYVAQCVTLAPQYEEEIREVMRRSPETVHSRDYALTWVKYLKSQGYRLYILSNYCHYMLEINRPMMDFLKYMDGIVFSCEVNKLKPDREMFQVLTEEYGLNPKKSVFLDDLETNCEGARKLGFHAICFAGFKQAAEELKKLGVE